MILAGPGCSLSQGCLGRPDLSKNCVAQISAFFPLPKGMFDFRIDRPAHLSNPFGLYSKYLMNLFLVVKYFHSTAVPGRRRFQPERRHCNKVRVARWILQKCAKWLVNSARNTQFRKLVISGNPVIIVIVITWHEKPPRFWVRLCRIDTTSLGHLAA